MNEQHILSVSELTRQIKFILESSLPALWVEGEISGFTWHTSGHMYFSLKDSDAQLRCVMWRSYNQHVFFTPRDGLKVQVQGKIALYEKGGQYQLSVYQMNPVGLGELRLAFERLANKLRAEGLFDPEHKKALPRFPTRIGVVTSPVGAAIQDIVRVVSRRFPPARIILRPVAVQGQGAAEQIARAIREFNDQGDVQVIIVGRGGGSPEDLWAFNEEIVARAIFASRIPVVSGVGHEIDLTISDLVADLRAPTPSAAGEMVVPHRREVLALLQAIHSRMTRTLVAWIRDRRQRIDALAVSHGMRRCADLVEQDGERLKVLRGRLDRGWEHLLMRWRGLLQTRIGQLNAFNPREVLVRGYSICRRLADLMIVSDAGVLRPGDNIEVTMARGRVEGSVTEVFSRDASKREEQAKNG